MAAWPQLPRLLPLHVKVIAGCLAGSRPAAPLLRISLLWLLLTPPAVLQLSPNWLPLLPLLVPLPLGSAEQVVQFVSLVCPQVAHRHACCLGASVQATRFLPPALAATGSCSKQPVLSCVSPAAQPGRRAAGTASAARGLPRWLALLRALQDVACQAGCWPLLLLLCCLLLHAPPAS